MKDRLYWGGSMATTFARRLRQLREARGLSKSALARLLNVTPTCVWNWEEGNTEPRADNLTALSKALDTSEDHLLSGVPWKGDVPLSGAFMGQSLPDVISDAKVRIARLAGVTPEKVNISLEY